MFLDSFILKYVIHQKALLTFLIEHVVIIALFIVFNFVSYLNLEEKTLYMIAPLFLIYGFYRIRFFMFIYEHLYPYIPDKSKFKHERYLRLKSYLKKSLILVIIYCLFIFTVPRIGLDQRSFPYALVIPLIPAMACMIYLYYFHHFCRASAYIALSESYKKLGIEVPNSQINRIVELIKKGPFQSAKRRREVFEIYGIC